MNRESVEQRAVSQTLCGALQKEANCKCLVLSVLIYGCLAAVTWCRCANVTKVVINFDNYPLKRTEHVSPCDEGYIYIPVAFMGMLYLVYLVECYHSPIRIDLLHAESHDNVMTKLSQLKLAQPTIWWKAVSYHYVRRKRQITRYRNGDNYTTTQVYYERANTHAATSFYFYEYCGVKDISKDLTMETEIPITKINLSKGFAFSNMRSATEFEEARSRFFAEQELRDDYMEMREGLDLGYNFNPTTVVGILGNPWFTNSYVYWCLSALLLSWPLRIIIEYNTQYADYQITKLFGVNYDTPTSGEPIHASSSQLSAPGSYMLAPSYSEALLMEPSPQQQQQQQQHHHQNQSANCQQSGQSSDDNQSPIDNFENDIVPSYSEALLYEKAQQQNPLDHDRICNCHCHASSRDDEIYDSTVFATNSTNVSAGTSTSTRVVEPTENSFCQSCQNYENFEIPDDFSNQRKFINDRRRGTNLTQHFRSNSLETSLPHFDGLPTNDRRISGNLVRDMSAPNFQTNWEFVAATNAQFLRINGNSLENILEHEEPSEISNTDSQTKTIGCGTIPKQKSRSTTVENAGSSSMTEAGYRVIENPIIDDDSTNRHQDSEINGDLTTSKTYLCLKSILKQHRRRYTLVTTEELKKLSNDVDVDLTSEKNSKASRETKRGHQLFNRENFCWRNRENSSVEPIFTDNKLRPVTSSRSLIFPSPIEEACRNVPNDPFGGKPMHVMPIRGANSPDYDETFGHPKFSKLAKSLTSVPHKNFPPDPLQRLRSARGRNHGKYHRRNLSIEPEYLLRTDGWNTSEENPVTEITIETESRDVATSDGQPGSVAPARIRGILTRGQSLNDGSTRSTERSNRKKILRTSLTDGIGSTSSVCSSDDRSRDDVNLLTTKRFNVSMETSL